MAHVDCEAASKSKAMLADAVAQPEPLWIGEAWEAGVVAHPPSIIAATVTQPRRREPLNGSELLPEFEGELPAPRAVQVAEVAIGFIGQRRILVEQIVDREPQPGSVERTVIFE